MICSNVNITWKDTWVEWFLSLFLFSIGLKVLHSFETSQCTCVGLHYYQSAVTDPSCSKWLDDLSDRQIGRIMCLARPPVCSSVSYGPKTLKRKGVEKPNWHERPPQCWGDRLAIFKLKRSKIKVKVTGRQKRQKWHLSSFLKVRGTESQPRPTRYSPWLGNVKVYFRLEFEISKCCIIARQMAG